MNRPKRKLKSNHEQPSNSMTEQGVVKVEQPQKWPLYAWRVRWQRLRRMLGKRR